MIITLGGVTADQIEDMRHALGIDGRYKKPYRNHYYTESDDKGWNDLVDRGLAKKGGGWEEGMCYFKVSIDGVRLLYKKKLTQKMIEDLRLESVLPKANDSTESA